LAQFTSAEVDVGRASFSSHVALDVRVAD